MRKSIFIGVTWSWKLDDVKIYSTVVEVGRTKDQAIRTVTLSMHQDQEDVQPEWIDTLKDTTQK